MKRENLFWLIIFVTFFIFSCGDTEFVLADSTRDVSQNTTPIENKNPANVEYISEDNIEEFNSNVSLEQKEHTSSSDRFDVSYGPSQFQKYDFYAPNKISNLLLVIVHGGAWVTGDKSYMASLPPFFASEDISVINMNYRLAPTYKYPAPLEDIATVLDSVLDNPQSFHLKNNFKIALLGHSAGAHLTSLYGVEENKYNGPKVDYIIGLSGTYDWVYALEHRGLIRSMFLKTFMGDASAKEVSPIFQISSGDETKYQLFAGSNDVEELPEQMDFFYQALIDSGITSEANLIEGRNHHTIFSRIPDNDIVAQKILAFLGLPI